MRAILVAIELIKKLIDAFSVAMKKKKAKKREEENEEIKTDPDSYQSDLFGKSSGRVSIDIKNRED